MWYLLWILGLGLSVLLAMGSALWLEAQDDKN